MFCIKISFLEPEPVEAELLWVEPEAKKYLEPEPRKNGSAPQHWLENITTYFIHKSL